MQKFLGLLFLIIAFNTRGHYLAINSQCASNPPDFSKLSYEQASEQIQDEERKKICPEYITNLVTELLHRNLDNDKKVFVIFLLGELRPIESNSIEALIQYIDLKATKFDEKTRIRRWGAYPAEEALIKIGSPVVTPILDHLTTESNNLRRRLMCIVLSVTEGKNGVNFSEPRGKQIAEDQLKERLAHESNLERRANLQAALNDLTRANDEKKP